MSKRTKDITRLFFLFGSALILYFYFPEVAKQKFVSLFDALVIIVNIISFAIYLDYFTSGYFLKR